MKRESILAGAILLFLSVINFTSCSNDVEIGNKPEIIKIIVSAQTGFYKSGDFTEDIPIEGMKIKESKNDDWDIIPFGKISDFEYEKGYNYELLVERTTSALISDPNYKLIKLLDKQKAIENKKMVEIYISAQTGLYKSSDLTQDIPSIEGMKIKEDGKDGWYVVPFDKITDFEYQKGYSYKLLVEKTSVIDIPIYVGSTTYKVIEVLSMKKGE